MFTSAYPSHSFREYYEKKSRTNDRNVILCKLEIIYDNGTNCSVYTENIFLIEFWYLPDSFLMGSLRCGGGADTNTPSTLLRGKVGRMIEMLPFASWKYDDHMGCSVYTNRLFIKFWYLSHNFLMGSQSCGGGPNYAIPIPSFGGRTHLKLGDRR